MSSSKTTFTTGDPNGVVGLEQFLFCSRGNRRRFERAASNLSPSRNNMSSTRAYNFIDHTFDVVVLGAGGAGLRATQGAVAAGLTTAWITKPPGRPSHTDR